MTNESKQTLATKPGKETKPRGQLVTGITIGVLIGLLLPTLLAVLPITRARIVEVVEGQPERAAPFELERIGDEIVSVHSFSKKFRNVGLTSGRIDRVEPIFVGPAASNAEVFVRYFDRGPIGGLKSRDVKVEIIVRIPQSRFNADMRQVSWKLYFFDDSGNEVGWYGLSYSFGQGDIPDDPFPLDSLERP